MQQNLNFQLTTHISILIPISSTSLFFQLTHQFSWISIPIPSTNLLFYLTYQFNLISISIPSTKGPANVSIDNSIGTPSNNLLLRESTNI